MFALTLPKRLPNLCSAIRETLGQRQIRQSPGLTLNAHSGNEWGKIPLLTGNSSPFHPHGFRLSSPIFLPLPFSSPSLRMYTSSAVLRLLEALAHISTWGPSPLLSRPVPVSVVQFPLPLIL